MDVNHVWWSVSARGEKKSFTFSIAEYRVNAVGDHQISFKTHVFAVLYNNIIITNLQLLLFRGASYVIICLFTIVLFRFVIYIIV